MSDFIDLGGVILRKDVIIGFRAYEEQKDKFIFKVYLDKQKHSESWIMWTIDNRADFDYYIKYTKVHLGLAVQQEGIEEDEEGV